MKLNEIRQKHPAELLGINIWAPDSQDIIDVSGFKLPNLEGCPEHIVYLRAVDCELKSLQGGPKIVDRTFMVSTNKLTTLDFAPEYVGQTFNCSGNMITHLHNIHKTVKRCQRFIFEGNPIKHSILGLCLVKQLVDISFSFSDDELSKAGEIINQVLFDYKDPSERLLHAQEQLYDAGLDQYAKL